MKDALLELNRLLQSRMERDPINPSKATPREEDDLLDCGWIDSVGIADMQAVIADRFGILISLEKLLTELRSLKRIGAYLAEFGNFDKPEKRNGDA